MACFPAARSASYEEYEHCLHKTRDTKKLFLRSHDLPDSRYNNSRRVFFSFPVPNSYFHTVHMVSLLPLCKLNHVEDKLPQFQPLHTLALTVPSRFRAWIGSICGIGLFFAKKINLRPATHRGNLWRACLSLWLQWSMFSVNIL